MQPYENLRQRFQKIADMEHLLSIISWDEAVMMPKGGSDVRARSMASLQSTIHELRSSNEVGDWLENTTPSNLATIDQANLREMKRIFSLARALPNDFVAKRAFAATTSEQKWRELRSRNDWTGYRPYLEEIFKYVKEEAHYFGKALGLAPYDALLDYYEPGMSAAKINPIFSELRQFIPGFLKEVLSQQTPLEPFKGPFSIEKQKELGLELMKANGFDFDHGRLDTSHHPFCGGVPDDVRMTTRYSTDNFSMSLMGILHETGHGMYEQGLPREWRGQPVGAALGMSIHESQSLFWEMQICRSRSYYQFAGNKIRATFGKENDPLWTDDMLWRQFTRVKPGLIRVDADEVSYPLHVILRYEIEQKLFNGELEIKDLPDVWDEKIQSYLGLSTKGNFKDGVMQDVHWPSGTFGYFPCYSLGAITAAQFFAACQKSQPRVEKDLGAGNLSPILSWLRKNVHSSGRIVNAETLVKQVSGEPLTAKYFIQHLENRYKLRKR